MSSAWKTVGMKLFEYFLGQFFFLGGGGGVTYFRTSVKTDILESYV